MSAVNTIANASQIVKEAAAEIRPPVNPAELREVVDRLARQRLRGEQIDVRLAELAGTARLKSANAVIAEAAARIDNAYFKLAACFRQVQCRRGFESGMLCKALLFINQATDAANDVAREIPSVNYNMTGTAPMFGGGSMDIDFSMIRSMNVNYLISASCGG